MRRLTQVLRTCRALARVCALLSLGVLLLLTSERSSSKVSHALRELEAWQSLSLPDIVREAGDTHTIYIDIFPAGFPPETADTLYLQESAFFAWFEQDDTLGYIASRIKEGVPVYVLELYQAPATEGAITAALVRARSAVERDLVQGIYRNNDGSPAALLPAEDVDARVELTCRPDNALIAEAAVERVGEGSGLAASLRASGSDLGGSLRFFRIPGGLVPDSADIEEAEQEIREHFRQSCSAAIDVSFVFSKRDNIKSAAGYRIGFAPEAWFNLGYLHTEAFAGLLERGGSGGDRTLFAEEGVNRRGGGSYQRPVLFPALRLFWGEVRDLTASEAARYLVDLEEAGAALEIGGLKMRGSWLDKAAIACIAGLLAMLLAHLQHIAKKVQRQSSSMALRWEVRDFPWGLLYEGLLPGILRVVTLAVLPSAAVAGVLLGSSDPILLKVGLGAVVLALVVRVTTRVWKLSMLGAAAGRGRG